jgi:hypothetical protein
VVKDAVLPLRVHEYRLEDHVLHEECTPRINVIISLPFYSQCCCCSPVI